MCNTNKKHANNHPAPDALRAAVPHLRVVRLATRDKPSSLGG